MEQTKTTQARAVGFAILAAALYALNAPLSKVLLGQVPARMMAALLYLGAGAGMLLLRLMQKSMGKSSAEAPLTRKELPYTVAMVVLDVAAPIFLMLGLTGTSAASASLLNNFEIVATSMIALAIFRERISGRLWLAIGLVTLSSIVLSLEGGGSLQFSLGSLLVLLACCCWGLENNCTRALSEKDPLEIVVVKGFGSGLGAMIVALVCGEHLPALLPALGALALGFVAYGLSIYLCPAHPWCSQNKHMVRHFALHRRRLVAGDLPPAPRSDVLGGAGHHGSRRLLRRYRRTVKTKVDSFESTFFML